MKIEIFFMDSKLTTEIKKDIQVQDLINDLKQYLNTTDSNFILFDSNYIPLKESDTISAKIDKESTFYLIKSSPNKNKIINLNTKENISEKANINELIKECTGAKKLLDVKKAAQINNLSLLDLLDNRNNNPGHEINPLDRLINILQVLEENQIPFRPTFHNANNNQVEADENALRELQDMGFPEDRAREALINSRNDINRATELLLGDVGE